MRKTTIAVLGAAALSATACGSSGGGSFADKPAPPSPINLTVYVNNSKVSISPARVGAGPIVFIVTNQGTRAQSLSIQADGGAHPIATTAPINPQGTTQLSVDVKPGDYSVATGAGRGTDAQLAAAPPIQPASLHIGPQRHAGTGSLITP
jgi:hypothetical protein